MTGWRCVAALVALGVMTAACERSVGVPETVSTPERSYSQLKDIRLAVPVYSEETGTRGWEGLAKHLEKTLQVRVTLIGAEPYSEIPQLVRRGEVDIAEVPPLVYVQLKEADVGTRALATPVISGGPTYLGHVYVRENSPYRSLESLRGARMAFVSKGSSSGYLFPRALMRARGLDPDTFFGHVRFYNTHVQVLEAVAKGEVDGGAAIDSTADWTVMQEMPSNLRVIAKTVRIPNDCVVARSGFDAGTARAVRDALTALHSSDPDVQEILAQMKLNGWVRADESRYDVIREVLRNEQRLTLTD